MAVKLVAAFAVAALSFRFVEAPARAQETLLRCGVATTRELVRQ